MNKSILAAWAISIGIATYAGYSLRGPITNKKITSVENRNNQKSSKFRTSGKKYGANGKRINTAPRGNRDSVNVVLADLKSLLGHSGMMSMDMAAFAESYLLVKNLNEEELVEALSQLQGNINSPTNIMPLMLIIGQYAEVNPESAMAFYENNITSPQSKAMALSGIYSSWSKTDPEGAYEWFQKKRNNDNSDGLMDKSSLGLIYIFQGLAKKDLSSTIEKFKDLNNSRLSTQMATSGIASSLREKDDFIEVVNKTSSMEDKSLRNMAIQNWVMKNPNEATNWIDSLKDEKEKKILNKQVLSSWMDNDPQNAATWYISKADEKDKQSAVDNIIQHWSFRNPKATMEWIKNQEGIDSKESIKNLFNSALYINPEYVADNLGEITDKKIKKELSQKVYTQLQTQNREKAKEFLENSPFRGDLGKKF